MHAFSTHGHNWRQRWRVHSIDKLRWVWNGENSLSINLKHAVTFRLTLVRPSLLWVCHTVVGLNKYYKILNLEVNSLPLTNADPLQLGAWCVRIEWDSNIHVCVNVRVRQTEKSARIWGLLSPSSKKLEKTYITPALSQSHGSPREEDHHNNAAQKKPTENDCSVPRVSYTASQVGRKQRNSRSNHLEKSIIIACTKIERVTIDPCIFLVTHRRTSCIKKH